MTDRADLLTVAEAVAAYGHTRNWWYAQVKAGHLTLYDIPGDRNTYLSRAEIERYLQPRPRPRPGEGEPGAGGSASA